MVFMSLEKANESLERCHEYWHESSRLLHLSMQGIHGLRGRPEIIKLLARVDHTLGTVREDNPAELEEADAIASWAQKERDNGFPLLHAHTVVGMWGALEAAIEDMLVVLLCEEPERLQKEPLSKVRISIAEFEVLDQEQRMRLLLDEMQRNAGGQKYGTDKFDGVLGRFGLSGPLDPEVKKDMRELHHVRNVIVHRASRADRRLVDGCPWMGLKIGDVVQVRHEDFERYFTALEEYFGVIIIRLGLFYKIDYSDLTDKMTPRVRAIYQQMMDNRGTEEAHVGQVAANPHYSSNPER
jgi:hypothetical protein